MLKTLLQQFGKGLVNFWQRVAVQIQTKGRWLRQTAATDPDIQVEQWLIGGDASRGGHGGPHGGPYHE